MNLRPASEGAFVEIINSGCESRSTGATFIGSMTEVATNSLALVSLTGAAPAFSKVKVDLT